MSKVTSLLGIVSSLVLTRVDIHRLSLFLEFGVVWTRMSVVLVLSVMLLCQVSPLLLKLI